MSAAPYRIVFANEKGGTGKSTTAVHVAIALAYQGAVTINPKAVSTWIQLGHALKESGDFAGAESAYRVGELRRRAPSEGAGSALGSQDRDAAQLGRKWRAENPKG